jgi:DNA-binding protein YbaB
MDGPVLATDPADGVRAFAAQAQEHATSLASALSGVAWGEDDAGAIRTALNHEGRVVSVMLSIRWRSRVDSLALGSAVVQAVSAAGQAMAEGRTVPARSGSDHAAPPPEPATTMPRNMPASPELATTWLASLLQEVESSMDELQATATRAAEREIEGRSGTGMVTAASRAGALVRVEVTQRWLQDATREQIQEELQQALAAALPGQVRQIKEALRGTGRVGELLHLAADPVALMRSLGLGHAADSTGARRDAA